jgi:TonB family protein
MVKGKSTCKTLKAIRRQIAEANDIKYEPRECHYDGPCLGTCPACEAEVRYLEQQLGLRRQLGWAVSLIGVSAGLLSACTSTGTKAVAEKSNGGESNMEVHEPAAGCDSMVVGKVAVPEEPDTASFANEQRSRQAATAPKAPLVAQEEDEQVLGGVQDPRIMAELQMMAPDTTKVYDVVEQMPMFPGGTQALMQFLKDNVQYPPECEEICIQGRVILTFVVERDGSITQAKVVKSLDPRLDAEALRVVKAMPKWIPGRQAGVTVAVKYTIPVTFRLICGSRGRFY